MLSYCDKVSSEKLVKNSTWIRGVIWNSILYSKDWFGKNWLSKDTKNEDKKKATRKR